MRRAQKARDKLDDMRNEFIGNWLEDMGIFSKSGGTGTGSLQYAMKHPAERVGHWVGLDEAGKTIDKAVDTVKDVVRSIPIVGWFF